MGLRIDIQEWPFVSIEERDKLPRMAGVYVAASEGEVLYVGQSTNIKQRWKSHEKLQELSAYPRVRVGWLKVEADDERDAIESLLWTRHSPVLNLCEPRRAGRSNHVCRIRLALSDALREKGKSLYWLSKMSDIRYPTIHRLATKPIKKVDLAVLEKISRTLGCEPGDLLVMGDD
jgi:DNA-binding Xre family transcriptional regulator